MRNSTGYQTGGGGSSPLATADAGLEIRKKEYLSYLDGKREEIKEQQNSRRYYHGAQWTAEQIKAFNLRKQPVVTYNRIGRKINAVVGLLEKQRADPKGYPRTPQHEEGAEIATATLRYVLDQAVWTDKSAMCGLNGAVDGLAGIELTLERGDKGDVEVSFEIVDPSSFFYDPRSMQADFSDARYVGVGKWADIDAAIELFPDKEQELRDSLEQGSELTSNPDKDNKWVTMEDGVRKIRLIDHWYKKNGQWHYCIYTGTVKLAEGVSPFKDERGKSSCKYLMFSANVDHDGDRYGFVRNMKSSQDEVNQRRSKALHILNTRRIIADKGAFDDIEKTRREAVRPDGIVIKNPGTEAEFDDSARNAETQGQLAFLEDAKTEIENYGFNPALIGSGVQDMSGRAIALQQQAGIAELGPFLVNFKGWKIRVYRAIWNAIQLHWQQERWIRVTDSEDMPQFFAVNKLDIDPMTGAPAIVNALGSLDVDIIIDEGPDTINMQGDTFETLSILAKQGGQVPPQLLIEMAPLHSSAKKKYLGILEQAMQSQPNPAQEQANLKKMEAEVAMQMKGKEFEANMAERQIELQNEERKQAMQFEADAARHAMEMEKLARQEEIDRQKGAIELAKLERQADLVGMEKQTRVDEARAKAEVETVEDRPLKEQLNTAVQNFAEAINELKRATLAPRKIALHRDENGKVSGAVSLSE